VPSAPSRPRLLTCWEGWHSTPLISSRFRPAAPPAADVVEAADAVEVVEGVRLCGVRLVSGRSIEQKFDEQAKRTGPPLRAKTSVVLDCSSRLRFAYLSIACPQDPSPAHSGDYQVV
jgi:hypothetical protein